MEELVCGCEWWWWWWCELPAAVFVGVIYIIIAKHARSNIESEVVVWAMNAQFGGTKIDPKKKNKKLIKQSTNLLVSCLRIDSKLKNWKHKKFITKINFVQDLIGIWRLRLRAFLSFINVISIYSIIIINKIQDYMKVWVKGMWHYHDYQPPIPWISAVRLLINFSVSMVNAWELDIEVSENW